MNEHNNLFKINNSKFIKIIFLICCCLLVSGCWDQVELEQLAMVIGVGIDYEPETKEIKLVTEIMKPGQMKSPGPSTSVTGSEDSEGAVFLLESKGRTVFEAVRELARENSRRTKWTHSEVIILGKSVVEKGASNFLDYFIRDPEPRPLQWILVAETESKTVFEAKPELESAVAMAVDGLLENAKLTSKVQPVDLIQFISYLISKTTSPTAPIITASNEGDNKKLELSGTAVFKKDKMVGRLNLVETRGMLWVTGKVKSGVIVIDLGDEQWNCLKIIRAKSSFKPRLKDGELEVEVNVNLITTLGGQISDVDMSTSEGLKILEKLAAKEINKEVMGAVKKAQSLRTDIFGFGEAFHRKYPKRWAKLEPDWEQLFPKIKVKVRSNVIVELVGKTTKPLGTL